MTASSRHPIRRDAFLLALVAMAAAALTSWAPSAEAFGLATPPALRSDMLKCKMSFTSATQHGGGCVQEIGDRGNNRRGRTAASAVATTCLLVAQNGALVTRSAVQIGAQSGAGSTRQRRSPRRSMMTCRVAPPRKYGSSVRLGANRRGVRYWIRTLKVAAGVSCFCLSGGTMYSEVYISVRCALEQRIVCVIDVSTNIRVEQVRQWDISLIEDCSVDVYLGERASVGGCDLRTKSIRIGTVRYRQRTVHTGNTEPSVQRRVVESDPCIVRELVLYRLTFRHRSRR